MGMMSGQQFAVCKPTGEQVMVTIPQGMSAGQLLMIQQPIPYQN